MSSLDPVTQIQLICGGYYLSRCLQIAAELGIADLIEREPISAAQLATSTNSHPEALFRVLSLLCAHGVFERVGGGFRPSNLSRFIRTDHPASMRSFARMFGIPLIWKSAIRLDESVATGSSMGDDATEGGFWRYFEDHPEDNAKFNGAMAAKAQVVVPLVVRAYDFESIPRIVDVGGGRGIFWTQSFSRLSGLPAFCLINRTWYRRQQESQGTGCECSVGTSFMTPFRKPKPIS
jgi:hypothetical protein